ncbi:helix-turn-helix transcriptional regulator [Streptomyces sp. SRF1]|uniref:helix-turn-helix domain-containing protein n=1 Tax=Streptomyces sp. SRF1 TaxID=1549642 RepID=UPI0025B19205|nr:helix-turn-helix transcriptional regulator [Streptomyces sp. SRF1]MDN3059400.1 helix-turn-helix transcriptional regulator [Streptomyces sp. SRF1]
MLAKHLQMLRERAGRSFAQAADRLGVHHTTIRRMEQGLGRPPRPPDLRELLSFYGAGTGEVSALVELAEKALGRNWWDEYHPTEAMADCVMLEGGAERIRAYAPWEVPALLQTQDYARALGSGPDPDRWLGLLKRRQAVLEDDAGPLLWAVIDEPVLHWQVGSPGIMADQLAHLLEMAARPRVDLRVVPFSAGPSPAARAGACCVYRLRLRELPDIVCVQQLDGLDFVDKPSAVTHYTAVLDQTVGKATRRGEETRLLLERIKDHWRAA